MRDCHTCEVVEKIFKEVLPQFPNVEFEEIDMVSPRGQELIQKHRIFAAPAIIIDEQLFSTGGVSKEKLVEKLKVSA